MHHGYVPHISWWSTLLRTCLTRRRMCTFIRWSVHIRSQRHQRTPSDVRESVPQARFRRNSRLTCRGNTFVHAGSAVMGEADQAYLNGPGPPVQIWDHSFLNGPGPPVHTSDSPDWAAPPAAGAGSSAEIGNAAASHPQVDQSYEMFAYTVCCLCQTTPFSIQDSDQLDKFCHQLVRSAWHCCSFLLCRTNEMLANRRQQCRCQK